MDEWPYPTGTYVMARHRDGLPLRRKCADHLWRLETDAKEVDYGCGYSQVASCLICADGITPWLDADFFIEKVTSDHVATCLLEVRRLTDHYAHMRDVLEHWGGQSWARKNYD